MKVIFRADGNQKIGMGHIMRCLSIAEAFRRLGHECVFVMADESVRTVVTSKGFPCLVLDTGFDRMEEETDKLEKIWRDIRPGMTVVDSYFVTADYFKTVRNLDKGENPECRLVYIDDLAAFPYLVDILVNYNIYAPYLKYDTIYRDAGMEEPRVLTGIDYAPLRAEFQGLPGHGVKEKCENILVSTGGADPVHMALSCLKYLKMQPKADGSLTYHFVLGAMNLDTAEIQSMAKGMDNIVIHKNVTDMKSLMYSCDAAVSAAGSTLYELCACGIPSITYVLADNQLAGAEGFAKKGLMRSIGDVRDRTEAVPILFRELWDLCRDFPLRENMSRRMQETVDGRGADRLVKALLCSVDSLPG